MKLKKHFNGLFDVSLPSPKMSKLVDNISKQKYQQYLTLKD